MYNFTKKRNIGLHVHHLLKNCVLLSTPSSVFPAVI